VSTIAGSIVTMTTVTSTMNYATNDEKKQAEVDEFDEEEKYMEWEYYVMRALMILGTCTVPYYFDLILF